uniref:Kinesin motor domain-containing protein n=1 Tax=Salix viminalis TaxID=40686 RepID=A0A6N2N7C0_SALVM
MLLGKDGRNTGNTSIKDDTENAVDNSRRWNQGSRREILVHKVFDPSCSTLKVYEEGAKNVALSALTGINGNYYYYYDDDDNGGGDDEFDEETIFAYGQSSSGKTYTMRGITRAVTDIFEHIKNTQERAFVLKVSALEIYNESVIDLLNRESGHLRLLDDPERGSLWKASEEVVRNFI